MADRKTPFNVVDLNNETDSAKIAGLVEKARREFSARLPVFEMIARERWAQFDAYKTEGFSQEQALRLIIADIQRPYS